VNASHSQQLYQVRFDWGLAGAATVAADVDVVVWVDQLGEAHSGLPTGLVVAGGIQNRAAIAAWVLERQAAKSDRFTVAVIAAGEPRDDASLRFTVEDLLAAGAVIDALAKLGIDHCSPEAAAAAAAYTGLKHAAKHLITASASARAMERPVIDLAESGAVVVLREFDLPD
jgi:2-phosphosulfolactate phosphatase